MRSRRKPDWLKMPSRGSEDAAKVRSLLRRFGLETVCREARCPNIGHCFQRGTATFLILGRLCTRSCAYCAIEKSISSPLPPDPGEPLRVGQAAKEMGLSYVVLTSVTRDDLEDGGAGQFSSTARELRKSVRGIKVEMLTPDFRGSHASLRIIAGSQPDVFNHNLETVKRLFPSVRPEASYSMSLKLLKEYGAVSPGTPLKSGLMLGLGESAEEVSAALQDLRESGVTMLTLGQYLQPTRSHWPVDRYVEPSEFQEWRERAMEMGFTTVASGPLVRSSFHADLDFRGIQD